MNEAYGISADKTTDKLVDDNTNQDSSKEDAGAMLKGDDSFQYEWLIFDKSGNRSILETILVQRRNKLVR